MNRNDIRASLSELIEDVLDLDDLDLKDADTAKDIEGWDSLSHIRIMARIERKFGIHFSNAEVEKLNSVADLVDAIQGKLA
jgi:acyl carrier protein